jgi:hypothetical protein
MDDRALFAELLEPDEMPDELRAAGDLPGHEFHGNQWTTRGGGGSLKSTSRRAMEAPTGERPSKLETGRLGEELAVRFLQDQGFKDARTLNVERNNFPVDLVEDHRVYEVKAGLASNGLQAQQWRATIGQPGPKEAAWLARVSERTKAAHNERKMQAILERKHAAVREVGQRLGRLVKGATMGLIINPATKTVDVHVMEGFHLRVGWSSAQAKESYRGSYKY